jgi:hypothetical protein
MLCELLDEHVPSQLYVVCGWVQGVEPGADISGPCGYFRSLDECQRYSYLPYGGVEAWDSGVGVEVSEYCVEEVPGVCSFSVEYLG